jgi:hypothetical protein
MRRLAPITSLAVAHGGPDEEFRVEAAQSPEQGFIW